MWLRGSIADPISAATSSQSTYARAVHTTFCVAARRLPGNCPDEVLPDPPDGDLQCFVQMPSTARTATELRANEARLRLALALASSALASLIVAAAGPSQRQCYRPLFRIRAPLNIIKAAYL
jgi:hypothetical protein